MTGLELLKEEMLKRGCSKAQLKSGVVPVVLDIVSQSGDLYKATDEAEKHLGELKRSIEHYEREERVCKSSYTLAKNDLDLLRAQLDRLREEKDKLYEEAYAKVAKEATEYIEKFYKALEEVETPEGRDKLRMAQIFVNTVNVDTKYDNTGFIVALGSLLAGIPYAPMETLKKINKKIAIPVCVVPLDGVDGKIRRRASLGRV